MQKVKDKMAKLKFVNGIAKNPGGQGYYIRWYEYELDENNRKVSKEKYQLFPDINGVKEAKDRRVDLIRQAKKEFENISINKILELTLAEYFFQDFYIQHIKKLERGTQSYYFHTFSRLAKLDKKTNEITYNHPLAKVKLKDLPANKSLINGYVNQLTASKEDTIHGLEGYGLANNTARNDYATLHKLIQFGLGEEIWEDDPMGKYHRKIKKPPKETNRAKRARAIPIHPSTINDIVKRLEDDSQIYNTLVMFHTRTGLRVEEVLALRWEDINFADPDGVIVSVNGKVTTAEPTPYEDGIRHNFSFTPKADSAGKRLAISDDVTQQLIKYKEIQKKLAEYKESDSSLMFAKHNRWEPESDIFKEGQPEPTWWVLDILNGKIQTGEPITQDGYHKRLKTITRKIDRPDITPKTFRHLYASVCPQVGINDTKRMMYLAHSTTDIATEYYDDVQLDTAQADANSIESWFKVTS